MMTDVQREYNQSSRGASPTVGPSRDHILRADPRSGMQKNLRYLSHSRYRLGIHPKNR